MEIKIDKNLTLEQFKNLNSGSLVATWLVRDARYTEKKLNLKGPVRMMIVTFTLKSYECETCGCKLLPNMKFVNVKIRDKVKISFCMVCAFIAYRRASADENWAPNIKGIQR